MEPEAALATNSALVTVAAENNKQKNEKRLLDKTASFFIAKIIIASI